MVIETPCKINVYLGIHSEKDSRGYHRVDSLMVPVALYDTVEVTPSDELHVYHEPKLEVSYNKTTVWRAALLLAEVLDREPNVCIKVQARIPERAGLGGSSADAGATLRALAEFWGVAPTDKRVVEVARRVGADVAFFLNPEPGLYLGAGDVLERTFEPVELPLALVMPITEGGSTKQTYDEFDANPLEPVSYAQACEAFESKDSKAIAQALYNNLSPAAARLNSGIAEVEQWLKGQAGVLGAQVTGSGACSFAICESAEVAKRIAEDAQQIHGWRAWATNTVGTNLQEC